MQSMATKNEGTKLLAKYGLLDGELPPTLITSLWHGGFSANRNPFAMCYYAHYPNLRVPEEERKKACEYLSRFGRTREEQARSYYLWAQTVPRPLWRYFSLLSLSDFTEVVADMVPPLAIANLIRYLDLYYYFRDAVVLDLYAGVCGWLMAFMFLPSHYLPRRWIATDIDSRRLQICRLISRDVGVDVEAVRRDLSVPYVPRGDVDVVVGSPPCHEFSAATTSRRRRVEDGLALVRSYLESVRMIAPALAVMEEAATTSESPKLLAQLLTQYGFRYGFFDLRDFGAIQLRRRRLIAWRGVELMFYYPSSDVKVTWRTS
jgi:predicted RNA methylase